ncbi:class I SAM-dependent methyltransferase [bacterium]|nr:class I SAM-dependent methyltransferase [bacterium]
MPESKQDLARVRRVYSAWGRHPRLYDAQDAITFLGRHRTIRQRAAAATSVGAGARVLEVGCGSGRNFPYIEELIGPTGRLVGFDYTEAMLDAARALVARRGWENVELVQGDAAVLDLGDEPFDGVLSALAMSVMPDLAAVLRRCRDVLRPGGTLAVCDASLFSGALRIFNPLVRAVYVRLTAWNPDRDIPAAMRSVFGNVSVERFNAGTFIIATSTKDADP